MKPTPEQIRKFQTLPARVQQMIVDEVLNIDDDLSEAIARAEGENEE